MKHLAAITLFIISFGFVFAPGLLHADQMQQLQIQLADKTGQLNEQQQIVNRIRREKNDIEKDVRMLQVRLTGQRAQMERAMEQLREKHDLVLRHPELSTHVERERYAKAKLDYDTLELELTNAESRLGLVESELESAIRLAGLIESDVQKLQGEIAELNFAAFRQQVEQERAVKARGEVSCGDMSIGECRRAALEQARRNAAESGSAVIVDSYTEVRDFQMERDEIRSRMQAIVLRHDILDEGFIGHSGYFYEISAVVQGQIPPEYYNEFKRMVAHRPVEKPKPPPPVIPLPVPAPPSPPQTHQLIIVTQPVEAVVSLIDPIVPYTPGMQLAPGIYQVKASAEGYVSKEERIQIIDSDVTHTITLSRIPDPLFRLTIKTTPSDARVHIIDPPMTYTAGMHLRPGTYLVEVSADGFLTRQESIHIAKSDKTHAISLDRIPEARYKLFVETSPDNTRIRILNIGPVFAQGIELTSGRYQIEASADGYETKREWIEVTNSDLRHSMTLNPLPPPRHRLTIRTQPANARVVLKEPPLDYRDGLTLKAGKYLVVVSADGYVPREEWIQIVNRDIIRTISLDPVPPSQYRLTVRPNPTHATIRLIDPAMPYSDGMRLAPGNYVVEISADGYISERETIRIVNSDVSHSVRLHRFEPTRFKLFVKTDPANAQIRILNIRPPFEQGIELEPGAYHIEATADGYETMMEWIQVSNRDVNHTMTLERVAPAQHRLSIRTQPVGARVVLKEPAMTYREGMLLEPGRYLVEVSAEGYISKEKWIQIAGADVSQMITLLKQPVPDSPPVDIHIVERDRHLVLLKSGVVRDTRSGLEWYMGPDRDTTRRNAETWANRLNVDGGGWRLPDSNELETIFEPGQGSRNMSSLFNTRGWFFWADNLNINPFDFSAGAQRWHSLKAASQSRGIAVRESKL